jgi:hypothetical protein
MTDQKIRQLKATVEYKGDKYDITYIPASKERYAKSGLERDEGIIRTALSRAHEVAHCYKITYTYEFLGAKATVHGSM